ncbi:unnamed protein product [Rotaria sp. Silwood2]|nr:unnamed protein product [Rotaria sp. Silwood2]
MKDNGVIIDLIRERSIILNNIELSNYQIQPITFGRIYIYQLGIYTIIKTDDFIVKWDSQTYVDITVQSNSEMSGLCGNNNDNFDDDFKSANGASQLNVFDMAQSWQTSVQCSSEKNQSINNDPCGDSLVHAQRRMWAQNKCDLIKIKSSIFNNPFEICIEKMETHLIEKYYQACLYDACHADHGGDCESVCTVLSAFAAECQSTIKTPIIKWRTSDRCPMQCDSGKVYMPCGPLCPQTCFEGNDYGGCIADSGCVDGCFCPNGQVMDNHGQCIEPDSCPCSYNNNIYPKNSRIIMKNDTCHHECECLNGTFICDQIENTTCITTNCTSNEFSCKSDGQCIPLTWKCDRIEDCLDGSDELDLNCKYQCADTMNTFQCSNEQCIHITHRCDGLLDCRDGSDEVNCSYAMPCKEYECPKSKLCIPKSWICDGTVDCGHGDDSDESGDCKLNQCDTLSGRYFQCPDNLNCLPIDQRCDSHKDCDDGSDEIGCSSCTCTSSFSCIHICQCIDSRRVCDGISDCIDGTDEYNCTGNCAKDEYTCLDGKCLNKDFLCDGMRHCSKGEDETHPDCISLTTTISTNTIPMPFTTSITTTPGPSTTSILGTTLIPLEKVTVTPTTTEPTCEIQSALINDQFISKPEFSTPIIGSISDLNPGNKGIEFLVNTPSNVVTIILPLKQNTTIINLIKFQILRPSNVNRFQLTFLDKQRQPIGQYKILSTDSKRSLTSPTIDKFPIEKNLFKKIRLLKLEILDTNDNQPPKHVTLLLRACFKQTKIPKQKNCTQIDAMNSLYTKNVIAKIGGTRPINSTYGNLLQGYDGITYNTSQAVIDIRIHNNILSRINEISIPDYILNRTNVKKIIVELFDRYHKRLFREKTTTMKVIINSKKKHRVRFIRISILETNDNYAPFNVTLSIKGCFYRKYPTKKTTKKYTQTATTTVTTKSTCHRINALAPEYAHKIIGQFEGTQPLPGLSFVNFITPSKIGVDYGTKSPIIIIRFQSNIVGQLDEISLVGQKNNIKQFQIDLFDFNNNLLFSKQTIYPENNV